MKKTFSIQAKVWEWPGDTPWHFIHLDTELSATLRASFPRAAMIPIEAKIGDTIWKTSLFRNNRDKNYLLPIKKEVRKKEDIWSGEEVKVLVKIL